MQMMPDQIKFLNPRLRKHSAVTDHRLLGCLHCSGSDTLSLQVPVNVSTFICMGRHIS